nr:MAG TPA: hypothetical protein [Caudoviricetes sp.]
MRLTVAIFSFFLIHFSRLTQLLMVPTFRPYFSASTLMLAPFSYSYFINSFMFSFISVL